MTMMTKQNVEITRRLTTGESPKRIAKEMNVPINRVYIQNYNLRQRMKRDKLKAEKNAKKAIKPVATVTIPFNELTQLRKEMEEYKRRAGSLEMVNKGLTKEMNDAVKKKDAVEADLEKTIGLCALHEVKAVTLTRQVKILARMVAELAGDV